MTITHTTSPPRSLPGCPAPPDRTLDWAALQALVGGSACIAADHRAQLRDAALSARLDPDQAARETDPSGLMEGLYVKVEADGADAPLSSSEDVSPCRPAVAQPTIPRCVT